MTHPEDATRTATKLEESRDITDGFRVHTKVGRPEWRGVLRTIAQNHAPGTACYVASTQSPLSLHCHTI